MLSKDGHRLNPYSPSLFDLRVFVLLRSKTEHLVSCLQREVAEDFEVEGRKKKLNVMQLVDNKINTGRALF